MKKLIVFIFALILSFPLFSQSSKTLVSSYKVDKAYMVEMEKCNDLTFVQNENLPTGTIRVYLTVNANCDIETLTALCKKGRYFADMTKTSIVLGVDDTTVFFGQDRTKLEESFSIEVEMNFETSLLASK